MAIQMMMAIQTMEMRETHPIQTTQTHQMWAHQTGPAKHYHGSPNHQCTKKGSFRTMLTMSWPILRSLFEVKIYLPVMWMPDNRVCPCPLAHFSLAHLIHVDSLCIAQKQIWRGILVRPLCKPTPLFLVGSLLYMVS
jgi:hypothetical protein